MSPYEELIRRLLQRLLIRGLLIRDPLLGLLFLRQLIGGSLLCSSFLDSLIRALLLRL